MSSKLERTTFTITENQNKWLAKHSDRTGLLKSEIVRRALDEYTAREDTKEERRLLTSDQWREIREMARATGKSAVNVVRRAIDRERNRFFRRY